MAESNATQPQSANIVRSPVFLSAYSNATRMGHTLWDITVVFSSIEEGTNNQSPVLIDQAAIRMSPQHFKAFAQAAVRAVAAYERSCGPIVMPIGAQDQLEAQEGERTFD